MPDAHASPSLKKSEVFQIKAYSILYSFFRRMVVHVSERRASRWGRWINAVVYAPYKKRRLRNYQKFFGTVDPKRDAELENLHYRYLGQLMIDCVRDPYFGWENLRKRSTLTGQEHISEALKLGKGVMLVTGHLGNYFAYHEVLSVNGYLVTNVSVRSPIPSCERQTNRMRERFKVKSVFVNENAARAAVKTFRRNGLFSVIFDFAMRPDQTVTLSMGRARMEFDLGPALLAIRYGVPVLPVNIDNAVPFRNHVSVQPSFPIPQEGTERERALRLLELWRDWLQEEIAKRPAQWWTWSVIDLLDPIPPKAN